MTQQAEIVTVPKWAWAIMGSLSVATLGLLVTFFLWLGTTVVAHGETLASINTALVQITETTSAQRDNSQELRSLKILTEVMQSQLHAVQVEISEVERRVDVLEASKVVQE